MAQQGKVYCAIAGEDLGENRVGGGGIEALADLQHTPLLGQAITNVRDACYAIYGAFHVLQEVQMLEGFFGLPGRRFLLLFLLQVLDYIPQELVAVQGRVISSSLQWVIMSTTFCSLFSLLPRRLLGVLWRKDAGSPGALPR